MYEDVKRFASEVPNEKKEQNWYRKRIANVTENAKYLHGIACHLLNTTQDCKRSAENVLLKTKRMRNITVTMCSLAALHTSAETATTEDNVRTLLCRFTAKNVDLQRNANDGWCSATHQKPSIVVWEARARAEGKRPWCAIAAEMSFA